MSNITKSLNKIFQVPEDVEDATPNMESEEKTETLQTQIQKFSGEDCLATIEASEDLVPYVEPTQEEKDFELVRDNLKDMMKKGSIALDNIISVAGDTDKPTAYEAVAVVMKTLMEANKELMDQHKKHRDFNKDSTDSRTHQVNSGVNVEQAVFVGTPAELLKLIKAEKKNGN